MIRRAFPVLVLIVVFAATAAFSQTKIEKSPAPYTSAASGQEMYKAYCASCHGLDGKGAGPAAAAQTPVACSTPSMKKERIVSVPLKFKSRAVRVADK